MNQFNPGSDNCLSSLFSLPILCRPTCAVITSQAPGMAADPAGSPPRFPLRRPAASSLTIRIHRPIRCVPCWSPWHCRPQADRSDLRPMAVAPSRAKGPLCPPRLLRLTPASQPAFVPPEFASYQRLGHTCTLATVPTIDIVRGASPLMNDPG